MGSPYQPPITTAVYLAEARLDEADRHLLQQEAELRLAHLFWRGLARPSFSPTERMVRWGLESTVQPHLAWDGRSVVRRWVTGDVERLRQVGGLRDDPPWIEAGICRGIEWAGETLERLAREGWVTKDEAGGYWRA